MDLDWAVEVGLGELLQHAVFDFQRDGLVVLLVQQPLFDAAIVGGQRSQEVGRADHAVRVNHVGEDVLNVTSRTVQSRANGLPFTLELVALRAVGLKHRLAAPERRRAVAQLRAHRVDRLQQLVRRGSSAAPGFFDERVNVLVVEGLNANDRVVGHVGAGQGLGVHRAQKFACPLFATGQNVDQFRFHGRRVLRPIGQHLLRKPRLVERRQPACRFDPHGLFGIGVHHADEEFVPVRYFQRGELADRFGTGFDGFRRVDRNCGRAFHRRRVAEADGEFVRQANQSRLATAGNFVLQLRPTFGRRDGLLVQRNRQTVERLLAAVRVLQPGDELHAQRQVRGVPRGH